MNYDGYRIHFDGEEENFKKCVDLFDKFKTTEKFNIDDFKIFKTFKVCQEVDLWCSWIDMSLTDRTSILKAQTWEKGSKKP